MQQHWTWSRGVIVIADVIAAVRRGRRDISRFPPRIDLIFPGEALDPFFGAQDKGFSEFDLHKCIFVFDAEQVYLKLQVTNLINKEVLVTLNPNP